MSPEFHQQVRKRFEEALDRPESARLPFLDLACQGEPEVLEAVRRLLDARLNGKNFLADGKSASRRFGREYL